MNSIKLTIGFIVAITLMIIGYDIYVATNGVSNSLDTVSGRLRIWAFQTLLVPWVWCGLAGHFFGPFHANQFISSKSAIVILVFLSWAVMWFDMLFRSKGIVIPPWAIVFPAFFAGAILWAQ